jgi:hypothetical protein
MPRKNIQTFFDWFERQNTVVQGATITGFFTVLVAVIGGCFLLVSTIIGRPVTIVGAASVTPQQLNFTPLATDLPQPSETASPTLSPFPTITLTEDSSLPPWRFDNLIYEETFEDQIADGLEITAGKFEIVQTSDGNHVWRTDYNGTSELTLPIESNDYAIQARIMQVSASDAGQGTFWMRMEGNVGCPGYLVYMVVLEDRIRLAEKDSDCNEVPDGLYDEYNDNLSDGVWYTVRIEIKGAEVRVYWDGKRVLHAEDADGDIKQSNVIGFAACCNEPYTHTFDFDDIRVWEGGP